GAVRGAQLGNGGGDVGDSESGRSLCAAGSQLSVRTFGVHVGRCTSTCTAYPKPCHPEATGDQCQNTVPRCGNGMYRSKERCKSWEESESRESRLSHLHFRLHGGS